MSLASSASAISWSSLLPHHSPAVVNVHQLTVFLHPGRPVAPIVIQSLPDAVNNDRALLYCILRPCLPVRRRRILSTGTRLRDRRCFLSPIAMRDPARNSPQSGRFHPLHRRSSPNRWLLLSATSHRQCIQMSGSTSPPRQRLPMSHSPADQRGIPEE